MHSYVTYLTSSINEPPMSIEHAKAFIERMNTDEAFSNTIKAIENQDHVIHAVREAGYKCNVDEINILICASGPISDELLF